MGTADKLFSCLDGLEMGKRQYEWLERRFESMTAKECLAFTAAVTMEPPSSVEEAIDIASQLDKFSLLYGAHDTASLRDYYMKYIETVPSDARPYLDPEKVGLTYLGTVTGCFCGGQFLRRDEEIVHGGEQNLDRLPTEGPYAIRVRLASRNNMDGVWVGFPDQGEITADLYPDELRLALDTLGVKSPGECIVLEADCCLPQIEDIPAQYDSTEKLLNHAINLGWVWQEQDQGSPHFMDKWQAVLELEDVHRLDEALDYGLNLHRYHFIPRGGYAEFGREQAQLDGVLPRDPALAALFNGEAYAGDYAKRHGMSVTDHGLAAWNGQELHFEFSHQDQGPQMTM